MRTWAPVTAPFFARHQIPHNMQNDNAQQPGGNTRTERVDTGFKSFAEFMENREKEGVTGALSPNAELMLELVNKVRGWQDGGENTAKDAVFVVAKVKGGEKNGSPAMIMQMGVNGTLEDLVDGLANAFIEQPIMREVAMRAVRKAETHRMGEALSHLAEFFKGVR